MLSLPGISEEVKPARLGVTRGYGLGSLWAEILYDRPALKRGVRNKEASNP